MPSSSTLATFAVAAFALVALPGPNMLYLLARTVSEGRRAGVLSAKRPAATQIVVLGGVLAAIGLIVGVATALAAGSLARRVRARRRGGRRPWARWAGGGVYLALGVYAAVGPAHRTAR